MKTVEKKYRLPAALRGRRIAFIGAGKMGQAILRGLLNCGMPARNLIAADPDAGMRREIKKLGAVKLAADPAAAADAGIIILAVKPQVMGPVLEQVRPICREDALVISIAAGITLRRLQRELPRRAVVRAMPNLPATVGRGFTALAAGKRCTAAQAEVARALFQAVGQAVMVPERHFDAITAVSGSGPAYLFAFAGAWLQAARRCGLPAPVAEAAVMRTLEGALALLQRSDLPAETLVKHVSSKGGTTEAAFRVLERRQFSEALAEAIAAAAQRSKELAC